MGTSPAKGGREDGRRKHGQCSAAQTLGEGEGATEQAIVGRMAYSHSMGQLQEGGGWRW